MLFIKPSARKKIAAAASTPAPTPPDPEPTRWSDVAASRKTTHPAVAPIKRVLDTYELLENVLEYLTLLDLIRVKRVCWAVNNCITTSPKLQKNLFLTAAPVSQHRQWVINSNHELLAGSKADEHIASCRATGITPNSTNIYVLNPFMFTATTDEKGVYEQLRTLQLHPTWSVGSFAFKPRKVTSAPPNTTCRSMLITQPPVTRIAYSVEGRCYYPDWEDRRGLPKWDYGTVSSPTITNPTGVTVGQVLDSMEMELRGDNGCSFPRITGGLAVSHELAEFVESAGIIRG